MAHSDDDLYEQIEPKEETRQIIVFRLGREWYGVDILKVREVIKVARIAYLPSSPPHIAGILNLRGNILSVTDLKTIFGLAQDEPTEKRRVIAVESGSVETGLLVDEVVESIEVPAQKIEPVLLTLQAGRAGYIEGQCQLDDKLIALVSVDKVLERSNT